MPLNMKVYISTNITILDVNEKPLETGKYYFMIEQLTENNHVKGMIIKSNGSIDKYEFRYFSFLLMTVKAQSVLARRAGIKDPRMPNFSSPIITKKKKKAYGQCSICLISVKTKLNAKQLDCGHYFHKKCIKAWEKYNKSCPNCRKTFDTIKLENN